MYMAVWATVAAIRKERKQGFLYLGSDGIHRKPPRATERRTLEELLKDTVTASLALEKWH